MIALSATVAVVLDWCLGEPRRWHPLVGFGRYAHWTEARLHSGEPRSASSARACGALAVALTIAPAVAACALLAQIPYAAMVLGPGVLYLALGHRSLHQHAGRVADALRDGNLAEARRHVGRMVSRDTAALDEGRVAAAAVESVLENGNDAVLGALFWFAVLGAPGVLAYRLANTLDAMWGYRTPHYLHFGWAAARLDDLLNWIPARLTALSYALAGCTGAALRCWRQQAPAWDSPNAGPVMAAGAGSLRLQLGGPAVYHGCWKPRPVLGEGTTPQAKDIRRALRLVETALSLWLAVLALGALWHA